MNKKELIEKIKNLPFSYIWGEPYLNKEVVFDLVKQLDEPQKVTVPQFVANWYEKHKYNFEFNMWDYVYRFDTQEDTSFKEWLNDLKTESFKTLVNMHQFGYTVEKEKRYRISMPKARNYKNHAQFLCEKDGKMFWCAEWHRFRTKFTRKEIEDVGFGEVFNSPLFEVEEVTE